MSWRDFLRGMASLTLFPTPAPRPTCKLHGVAWCDWCALASDWEAIGGDLRRVIEGGATVQSDTGGKHYTRAILHDDPLRDGVEFVARLTYGAWAVMSRDALRNNGPMVVEWARGHLADNLTHELYGDIRQRLLDIRQALRPVVVAELPAHEALRLVDDAISAVDNYVVVDIEVPE